MFVLYKPNALGHLVLLWGTDTIMALVLAAGGLLPILHYQLMAMGCESGHGAALLVAAHAPVIQQWAPRGSSLIILWGLL